MKKKVLEKIDTWLVEILLNPNNYSIILDENENKLYSRYTVTHMSSMAEYQRIIAMAECDRDADVGEDGQVRDISTTSYILQVIFKDGNEVTIDGNSIAYAAYSLIDLALQKFEKARLEYEERAKPIKDCPLCGNTPIESKWTIEVAPGCSHVVECEKCLLALSAESADRAVVKWNNRGGANNHAAHATMHK